MSQRMRYLSLAVVGLVLGFGPPRAQAQVVLLQDNFDSYANQAAFTTVWTPAVAGGTGGGGQLSTAQAFSAPNSVMDLGNGSATSRNDRALSSAFTPTPSNSLSFQL